MSFERSRFPVADPVQSFWTASPQSLDSHRTTPDLPTSCDVLIIGSGFAGVSTAYHIFKDNPTPPSTVLLEARTACSGATGRNGGHVKPDTYFNMPKYAKMYGAETAAEIAKFESSQVFFVKELVEREGIDCDFHLTRAMDVFLDPQFARDTEAAYRESLRAGVVDLKDVAFTPKKDAERVSGVKNAMCCFSFTAAHLWPLKMVHHLLRLTISKGLNLQTTTPVTKVSPTPDSNGRWIIKTLRGNISALKVVFATNAYTSQLLPQYRDRIVPVRGTCSHITTPSGTESPHLPNTYSLRFNPQAYDYLIPRADGSIIVGGARQKFWRNKQSWYDNVDDSELVESAETYFDGYMQRHFRGWEHSGATTERVWTGIMGYSSDFIPHLGQVPQRPGQFILAGFSGHGMPQILLSSRAIAAMVRDGISFEETGLPRIYKTSLERISSDKSPLLESWQLWDESFNSKL